MSQKSIESPLASLAVGASLGLFSILLASSPAMAKNNGNGPCFPGAPGCAAPGQLKKQLKDVPGPIPIAGAFAVVCWSRTLRRKCLSNTSSLD